MEFIVFNLFLTLIIILLLIALSMVWPPDSPWSPWWRTNENVAKAACKLAKIKKGEIVYELGSGDGTFIMTAAKDFGAKSIGIEIDPARFWLSRMRISKNKLSSKVQVLRQNFFDVDIKNADVVFVYLVPKALNKLKPKFQKELKKGTRIISFIYEADLSLVDQDKENKLYLYKI